MSITVRVIFWGLIGFVPNEEGQKGLTALLVDPPDQYQECKHVPVVYLFEGECKGKDCSRVPTSYKVDSAMSLGTVTPPKLRWVLKDEDLEIFGREKKVKFSEKKRKKWRWFGALVQAPQSAGQATDFSWVPSLSTLTGGYGQVREDCLVASNDCKLSARFTVRSGRASACHLFHKPENNPTDDDRTVFIFDFKDQNKESLAQQAIADAVEVKFEVEGDHIDLYSWSFASDKKEQDSRMQKPEKEVASHHEVKKPSQKKLKRSARLTPAANSHVTLIVTNGRPLTDSSKGNKDKCEQSPPHSNVFFDLLARESPKLPQPTMVRCERRRPGSCEREITWLETLARQELKARIMELYVAPHSSTLCDGRTFQ